ncbi:MAG: hypothetical protein P4L46_14280 [Fimbriimonas sp.]|nr:hypothetical protein [Fimbriimonas sp.]
MTHPVDPNNPTTSPDGAVPAQAPKRFAVSLPCGITMFGCAAGYGGYFAWFKGAHGSVPVDILLGVPAIATIAFVLAGEAFPPLLASQRIGFPLTVTLPIVFNSFVFLTAILLTSTGNSLIAPYEQLAVAKFWQMPGVLALVTFTQIVCLSALAILKRGQTS